MPGTEPISLIGKPFETFSHTTRTNGQKDTLLDAVWTDLLVTENTLERAISRFAGPPRPQRAPSLI